MKLFYKFDEMEIKKIQKSLIKALSKVIKNKNKNEIFIKYNKENYKSISLRLVELCNGQNDK